MSLRLSVLLVALVLTCAELFSPPLLQAQKLKTDSTLDAKVRTFLRKHAGTWHDMNIPSSTGNLLYDLVIRNHATAALEIGTSTGHSAIWIAWALSKTGGRLITIEINKARYDQAVANFREAGLSDYIDARLANAHVLVKKLPGPFDFVFLDADKEWYKQYFIDIAPKLKVDGCFTAHNVTDPRRAGRNNRRGGTYDYADYVLDLPNFETTFSEVGAGLSMSVKQTK